MNTKRLLLILAALLSIQQAVCCTSIIASGKATANGRPLLWKHRDTGASDNFLYRVEKPGKIGYVGLFNGGDSLDLREAWMGMNDAGFAIMNTVAYNLAPNSPEWLDREGVVMAMALEECRCVDDFEALLMSLPKPMGVRTNFGCIDAYGNGAYFETDDYKWKRYDVSDVPSGVLIRTNYSMSGTPDGGMGYIRYANVEHILATPISDGSLTPASLTEGVSRCFYHSVLGFDASASGDEYLVDQGFVPRRSSTASIVVEGILPGETADEMVMWTVLGYPPVSPVVAATLDSIPSSLLPESPTDCHAPANKDALTRFREVFHITRGSGPHYIHMPTLLPLVEQAKAVSLEEYSRFRER